MADASWQIELLTDIGLGKRIASIVAKRLAKLLADIGEKPDALLLDLHLAGGAAMQLLKDLQAQQLSLPVLLLAESTELAYLQRAQALGVQALLVREGEFEHIVATLDQLLLAGEHAAPAHPLIH